MDQSPISLLDLLSINLVFRQTAPYLQPSALLSLASTNKPLRNLIYTSPEAWRHLNLRLVKSATIDSSPIDAGGISWRAERMDEALTEDDFYSGPLRGIFSKLHSKGVLQFVHTLVLDGLAVPADLVREIVAEERFNVRILSLRDCKHLNHTKLQQVLRYAVRPGRPGGSPKLQALYVFGHKDKDLPRLTQSKPDATSATAHQAPSGILAYEGAQIGSEWNSRSSATLSNIIPGDDQQRWYTRSGRALDRKTSAWADTLHACQGVIFFDAILCRGPRHDISLTQGKDFLQPMVANVALGPGGCETCASCPESRAIFGQSDERHLPLLAPPPTHSSTVRAAQRPESTNDTNTFPLFLARCEECLRGRWCERCNRWWCESCYAEPASRTATATADTPLPAARNLPTSLSGVHVQSVEWAGPAASGPAASQGAPIKVGVHRDCFGCGRTCEECKLKYIRTCRFCRAEYCIVDNEGSSETECDWCNQGGRRTRELF